VLKIIWSLNKEGFGSWYYLGQELLAMTREPRIARYYGNYGN